ncbi:zinc-binding alcohol dehydrogenase family protein [Candidatus Woesearchaeota archaeon]|nr:zinc-binding alcohol dehydrogenase family protein [Candidatus Woesearchaeota archaeon]
MDGSFETEAWVLKPRPVDFPKGELMSLEQRVVFIPAPDHGKTVVEPLFVTWEGNMGHAVEGSPIDTAAIRLQHPELEPLGDGIIIGNSGVVRGVEDGKLYMFFCNGRPDGFGYPETIAGYDDPGSIGLLAKMTKVKDYQLIPIPEDTTIPLEAWASFSLRGVTAFANWRVALGTYRVQVGVEQKPILNVVAWGGGVSLYEAQIAKHAGHNVIMFASGAEKVAELEALGIKGVDRTQFYHLNDVILAEAKAAQKDASQAAAFEAKHSLKPGDWVAAYKTEHAAFLKVISEKTDGGMVDIFIDYIGEPVAKPTHDALAREGLITTAGWKEGMVMRRVRAIDCIDRHPLVHTHYARRSEGEGAVRLFASGAIKGQWDTPLYGFGDVNTVAANYAAGKYTFVPVIQNNPVR